MEVIIITLLQYIRENDENSMNVQIATTFLKEIHHLHQPSLEDLALICHCSVSSFSRFLKSVGLKNYRHLMLLWKQPQLVYHHEGFNAHHYQDQIINNFQQLPIDEVQLRQIALNLRQAHRIVFVAFPTHQALTLDFQCKMMMEGIYIEIPSLSQMQETLASLTNKDLILYLSFSGKEKSFFELPQQIPTLLFTLFPSTLQKSSYLEVIYCGKSKEYGEEKFTFLYLLDCIHQTYHQLIQDVRI